MNEFKVVQDKVELNDGTDCVINNAILELVKEREEILLKECPSIKDIEIASHKFTFRTGKYPCEIRMPIKLYGELVRATSFGMDGSIMPTTAFGMEIIIDENLESFEVVGYEDFMGMRKVVK